MTQGFYGLLDFIGIPVAQGIGKIRYMLNEILDNTVTDLGRLSLTLDGVAVPIRKRKGVKRQPGVDASTQITVCKASDKPFSLKYMAMQKTSVLYPVEIAIVSPNPRDWVTNLDTYISWFDSILTLFVPPSLTSTSLWSTTVGSSKVYDVRVSPGDFLEPEIMANMFDVVKIGLDVSATLIA